MAKSIDITGVKYGKLIVTEMLRQYKNNRTYCRCKCDCGNETIIQLSSIRNGNTKSCGCFNKLITSERSKRDVTNKKYGKLIVKRMLYKYKDNYTFCECECECGNIVFTSLQSLTNGKKSCGCLNLDKLNVIGVTYNKLTVQKMLYKYKNNKTYCECLCECGKSATVLLNNLKTNKTKSCGCLLENHRKNGKYRIKNLTGFKFGMLTALNTTEKRTKNGGMIWNCQCECGNYKDVSNNDLKKGSVLSCGCKVVSQYEDSVESILIKNNIDFIKQYKFIECKNKRLLPFDFWIPNNSICIEVQGQQHYEPIKYFGGMDKFKKTIKNDNIKKKFCQDNNINLICLPYTLSNCEMEQQILKHLSPVTITV